MFHKRSWAIIFCLVIIIPTLASCKENSDSEGYSPQIPTSIPGSATSNNLRLYVTDILVGNAALPYMRLEHGNGYRPDEGWNPVALILAAENLSSQTRLSPGYLCGTLIDTGGYSRSVRVNYEFRRDRILLYNDSNWANLVMAPGMRTKRMVALTEIPQNQSPQTMTLKSVGDDFMVRDCDEREQREGLWSFNLTNLANISVPFDVSSQVSPVTDNIITYEEPGQYKITLSNFRFEPNEYYNQKGKLGCEFIEFKVDYTLENLGGYNYQLGQNDENTPFIIGADSLGNHIEAMLYSDNIGPGIQTTDSESLFSYSFDNATIPLSVERVYLMFSPTYRGHPTPMITVEFPSSLRQPPPNCNYN